MSNNNPITIYCIYNANGSILGEINYLFKKYLLGFDCSMCRISHNSFYEKKEWKDKVLQSDLNLKTVHIDEQSDDLYQFSNGKAPCVVGENNEGFKFIFENDELNEFNGNVQKFFEVLEKKVNSLF